MRVNNKELPFPRRVINSLNEWGSVSFSRKPHHMMLTLILFVNVIAVVTVSITAAVRKSLLQQYRQFQTTRE